ncbi:SH3 domain-containing protein [Photobacterium leiognathi]|uniref:SH3 domain-containing protein n=1 Tax=Photobacterium leiognathi TaxID=553611 RepID=UPI002982AE6C|nr:SH3 domain-containing protein [Photobacterium leiognathi]
MIKAIIKPAILAVTALGLCSTFINLAYATAGGPDYYDVLNIREEPVYSAKKLGEIPYDGICLQNRGCVGGVTYQEFSTLSDAELAVIRKQRPRWCKVNYQGTEGWVAAKYVMETQHYAACDKRELIHDLPSANK